MSCLSSLPRSYAAIRERLGSLPDGPGVYQFHDGSGRLLYVGKSVCLRVRVRSYFGAAAGRSRKLCRLRSRVRQVEWIETGSELEALLLESRLVKERHPPFNTLLRRYRHLVFLRLDLTDPFPRLEVTEEIRRDGSRYFGPLVLTDEAERLAGLLSDALRLRTCEVPGQRVSRIPPCLRRDLGLCHAPCEGARGRRGYGAAVRAVQEAFEQEGRPFRERLRAEMADAAERLLFERAARLRDALQTLDALSGRQQAVLSAVDALDLVAACPSRTPANLEVFLFRSGALAAQRTLSREGLRLPERALAAARDLLRQREEADHTLLPAASIVPRSAVPPADVPGPLLLVEPEVLDQLFIISRWLRRNSGEGRHFFLPADEEANFLALRLGAWLHEAAEENSIAAPAGVDARGMEAALVAEWADSA